MHNVNAVLAESPESNDFKRLNYLSNRSETYTSAGFG